MIVRGCDQGRLLGGGDIWADDEMAESKACVGTKLGRVFHGETSLQGVLGPDLRLCKSSLGLGQGGDGSQSSEPGDQGGG